MDLGAQEQPRSRVFREAGGLPRSISNNFGDPVEALDATVIPTENTAEALLRNLRLTPPKERTLPAGPQLHLLIVDEDEPVRRAVCEIATIMGFGATAADDAASALKVTEEQAVDVVLLDLKLRSGGTELLEELRRRLPRVPVIVMTAFATVQSAVEALRLGATDYLTKPFAMEELTTTLEQAAQERSFDLESRRVAESLNGEAAANGLVGDSPTLKKTLRMAAKVAHAQHPVLISGENGTGKRSLARIMHTSSRPEQAFCTLECAVKPAAILESDLFGFVRHENSSTREEHRGLLTLEGGCTLLLDEIGALPMDLQSRLLRALNERSVWPAGSAVSQPVTARLLATTTWDLALSVEAGAFRRDLLSKLTVVHLRMPALRERREDLPMLASHLLQRQSGERGLSYSFDTDAIRAICSYSWPGNVPELEAAIQRACAVSSGPVLHPVDLPTQLHHPARGDHGDTFIVDARASVNGHSNPAEQRSTPIQSIAEVERDAILKTLEKLNGDKIMTARLLGIGKTTLYRKLKEYGIEG